MIEEYEFTRRDILDNKSFSTSGEKYDRGQVVIIGGGRLFHGAPILALRGAARIASMVYFSTPETDKGVAERLKADLASFIWVGINEIDSYVKKSEAVLIGPGMMRSHTKEENFVCDAEGEQTRKITLELFGKFPEKKWIVDGGSLQLLSVDEIPKGSLVTPNKKEFEMLFDEKMEEKLDKREDQLVRLSLKHGLVILTKEDVSMVSDGKRVILIRGGNAGLIRGGVGDAVAGLTVGFAAKNDLMWSAAAATLLVKKAAERLFLEKGMMFSSDDIVDEAPKVYGEIVKNL